MVGGERRQWWAVHVQWGLRVEVLRFCVDESQPSCDAFGRLQA
jgi:hypothetical protein